MIEKATQLDARERYQTMDEMKDALVHSHVKRWRKKKSFIIGYEKNIIYTEKKMVGLYPYG